jgi:hypothetical protein
MPRRRYSQDLILECQRVISKRAGFRISKDQAELYLETLARLGNLALRVIAHKKAKKHNGENNSNR